ncbi:SEC-C domain-containing protein [Sorangium sp. So ce861]|uniref:SEC-C domain-containing protein n=1 Tax=Sorangium sp. So ce861 TaxID=3133323 RepID=UPI003F5E0E6C
MMDPLYLVIVLIAAGAAYVLSANRRAAPRETPAQRASSERVKSPGGSAATTSGEIPPEGDDDAPRDESSRAPGGPGVNRASKAPRSIDRGAPGDGEADLDGLPCPCGSGAPFRRCHGADDSDEPAAQPRPGSSPGSDDPASFPFTGKTVLYYDPSHGNQIVYFGRNGRCYLWYPGNRVILVGEWRVEGDTFCARYGTNVYNPVTRERGGSWERRPIREAGDTATDSVPGDIYGLTTGFPFILPAHPQFRSVYEPKLRHRSG